MISKMIFIRRQMHGFLQMDMEGLPKASPIIDKLYKLELLSRLISQCRSYAVMSLSDVFINYFPTFLFLELINALLLHFPICYFGKLLAKKQKVTHCVWYWLANIIMSRFLNYFYSNVCDMVLCEYGERLYICWIINYNLKFVLWISSPYSILRYFLISFLFFLFLFLSLFLILIPTFKFSM